MTEGYKGRLEMMMMSGEGCVEEIVVGRMCEKWSEGNKKERDSLFFFSVCSFTDARVMNRSLPQQGRSCNRQVMNSPEHKTEQT